MFGEHDQLGFLADQLLKCALAPEKLPDVANLLAAWLGGTFAAAPGDECTRSQMLPPAKLLAGELGRDAGADQLVLPATLVASAFAMPGPVAGDVSSCRRMVELLIKCRALNELSAHAINSAHCSHVAAIVLTQGGRVLDCDRRGSFFLRAGNVLRLVDGQLSCADAAAQARFASAFKETAEAGRTTNVLLHASGAPGERFCLTFTRTQGQLSDGSEGAGQAADVLCLAASLDGRRVATVRQLMELFGLSAAEARLARSICHGESVEDYARDQGVRLPTVRTQLSSIFNKTGCRRQAGLVRLISSIPVVRDAA